MTAFIITYYNLLYNLIYRQYKRNKLKKTSLIKWCLHQFPVCLKNHRHFDLHRENRKTTKHCKLFMKKNVNSKVLTSPQLQMWVIFAWMPVS